MENVFTCSKDEDFLLRPIIFLSIRFMVNTVVTFSNEHRNSSQIVRNRSKSICFVFIGFISIFIVLIPNFISIRFHSNDFLFHVFLITHSGKEKSTGELSFVFLNRKDEILRRLKIVSSIWNIFSRLNRFRGFFTWRNSSFATESSENDVENLRELFIEQEKINHSRLIRSRRIVHADSEIIFTFPNEREKASRKNHCGSSRSLDNLQRISIRFVKRKFFDFQLFFFSSSFSRRFIEVKRNQQTFLLHSIRFDLFQVSAMVWRRFSRCFSFSPTKRSIISFGFVFVKTKIKTNFSSRRFDKKSLTNRKWFSFSVSMGAAFHFIRRFDDFHRFPNSRKFQRRVRKKVSAKFLIFTFSSRV